VPIGSVGTGSGYGRGTGAGFGGRGTRVPTVRQAKAEIMGSLDKDLIRRIVRAHINEVRYCYNKGLARDPNLKGRLSIEFTIDGKGKVSKAVVKESTVKDVSVGECIAKQMLKWTFPKRRSAAAPRRSSTRSCSSRADPRPGPAAARRQFRQPHRCPPRAPSRAPAPCGPARRPAPA
jgi:hypothetical protein